MLENLDWCEGRVASKRANLALSTAWVLFAALAAIAPNAAKAETLSAALRATYLTNPKLEAERSSLRATDESVPQAKSNYRPRITLEGDAGVERTKTVPGSAENGTTHPYGYAISLQQQVFRGFRTVNAVNQAEAEVRAGRARLRAMEQTVLLDAVTAFMNVVRDQEVIKVRQKNVAVLRRHLDAARRRFAVSEVTKTDVAQSQARYSGGLSDLELARANLRASRANFLAVIGHPPGRLHVPAVPKWLLPRTNAEAVRFAETRQPAVVEALYQEQAARFAVDQITGELLPSINVNLQFSNRHDPTVLTRRGDTASIFGVLKVPLYQGGEVSSRVRQAKHLHVRRIQLIHEARQRTREEAITAWSLRKAATARIASQVAQVEANRLALDGVQREENVGQRTLLDVLDAEQELLNAQLSLLTTRRDLVVNTYRLIAATGVLTASDLKLDSKIYDANAHYREVRDKPWGITITYAKTDRGERVASKPSK